MKKYTLFALTLLALAAPLLAAPGQGGEFTVKKVDADFVPTPEYQVSVPISRPTGPAQKWAKVDVTFDALPDFTDEVTLTYYVLLADRLFVGRVNHVDVAKGRDLHSVMFMSPRTIERILGANKALTKNVFTNISVTISKPGVTAPISVAHLKPGAHGEWWTTMKLEEGFLLNKAETPFAPLGWDYYEPVKPAAAR